MREEIMANEKLRKKVTKSQTQKRNWRNTKEGVARATAWTEGHLVHNICAIRLNLRTSFLSLLSLEKQLGI